MCITARGGRSLAIVAPSMSNGVPSSQTHCLRISDRCALSAATNGKEMALSDEAHRRRCGCDEAWIEGGNELIGGGGLAVRPDAGAGGQGAKDDAVICASGAGFADAR